MISIKEIPKSGKIFGINNNLIYMQEVYVCSGCKKGLPRSQFHEFKTSSRKRPVTSLCRECRSEAYYSARYSTVCICCLKHRLLDSNSQCQDCNAEAGLRQCKGCAKLLPLFLLFYGANRTCKNCKKK
jgi:hypothetical protein